jgi:putative PEP-CTERM system histidine kinase
MNYLDLLPLTSFLFCTAIFLLVIFRRRWNITALAFCLAMASVALMEFANFLALRVSVIEKVLLYKRLSLLGEMLFAGNCLLFSVVFAKEDIEAAIKKWRWALPLVYILPGVLFVFLFVINQSMAAGDLRFIRLEQVASYFHILVLILVIMTLMNLENTFRSSSGSERWQIQYMIFGFGAILLFFIYILSQRILYNSIDLNNIYIMSAAILAANILISFSIIRNKIVDGDIYVSRKVIYSSFSLIAIGLYSIIVALSAQVLRSFDLQKNLKLDILLIFFAVIAMIIVFYKESFRRRAKALINRNFRKSKYVYRDEWLVFSTELSKKASTQEICGAFLKTMSERIFVKYASVWLIDDSRKKIFMMASRNLAAAGLKIRLDDKVIQYLYDKNHPVSKADILAHKALLPLGQEILTLLEQTKAELLVPLILAQRWVGLLTLGKIQTGENYNAIEDYGLLKSAAAHAASAINNARLFEERMKARELEAFHRLSSFIIHDLKNTTSMLSMVAQNAEKHFHDPEFQKDALQSISEAVARMNKMMGSLSNLPDRLELKLEDLDLNELINDVVEKLSLNGLGPVNIETQLGKLPRVRADVGEIYKVVHNLLLNAYEAMAGDGRVKVSTLANGESVVLSVSDDGPGMSPEFMDNSLFKAFKSTKRKGLGIGLYQCKAIVEAHNGKIEVESEPGNGSTFSVYLPIL